MPGQRQAHIIAGQTHLYLAQKLHEEEFLLTIEKGSPRLAWRKRPELKQEKTELTESGGKTLCLLC